MISSFAVMWMSLRYHVPVKFEVAMFITSWTIDIRMNIQIWLLYRRYKSEWYNIWWATIQDIAACACKVWSLFGQACGQKECSQMTMTTTTTTTTMPPLPTTDKSMIGIGSRPTFCREPKSNINIRWAEPKATRLSSYHLIRYMQIILNDAAVRWYYLYVITKYAAVVIDSVPIIIL